MAERRTAHSQHAHPETGMARPGAPDIEQRQRADIHHGNLGRKQGRQYNQGHEELDGQHQHQQRAP